MAGHSKWKNIQRKKSAMDAKRGRLFTRLAREIIIAAREGGGDPDTNPRLRMAIERAKANNMPKDKIINAIKRGTGELRGGGQLEEIFYEGYAPHGIAMMIYCVTDNRNRALSEIRHMLNKHGGSLGESGSVAWQFRRMAYFSIPAEGNDPDEILDLAIDAGAEDVAFDEYQIEIFAPVEAFKAIGDRLRAAGVQVQEAGIKMIPLQKISLPPEQAAQVLKVIEALEDLDDVQEVYANLDISDEAVAEYEKMTA
ncbi:MAG: YebC/PmpR family DNA-binding transcriptional regulator [Chloroflexi bacterium]|nr:YebC/PmpR family DNA-binding transcriptional regulator [Chloroflexota bacterium]